jgi:DNA-binding GntR family transcriptional regulator
MREHAALLKKWSEGQSRQAGALMHSHIESTRDDLARAIMRREPIRGVTRRRMHEPTMRTSR